MPPKTLDAEYHETTALIDKMLKANPTGYDHLLDEIRDFDQLSDKMPTMADRATPSTPPPSPPPTPASQVTMLATEAADEALEAELKSDLARDTQEAKKLAPAASEEPVLEQSMPQAEEATEDTPAPHSGVWRKAQIQREIQQQESLVTAQSGVEFREITAKQHRLDQAKLTLAKRRLEAAEHQRARTARLAHLTRRLPLALQLAGPSCTTGPGFEVQRGPA